MIYPHLYSMQTGINLNEKQQYAMDLMLSHQNVFITGPGGVGKSELIRQFKTHYMSIHKKWWETLGITSTTGCASLLLNGRTLHSLLGIGLGKGTYEDLISGMNSKSLKVWRSLDVLIIDEVSMLSPDLFDKLEQIGRILRKSPDKPFGGIQIILSGDFCQLPIVGNEDVFCFDAKSWSSVIQPNNIIYLDVIIRQRDVVFQKALNEVRLGIVSDETKMLLDSYTRPYPPEKNILPTRICATNYEVDNINRREYNIILKHDEPEQVYEMKLESRSSDYECKNVIKNMQCDEKLNLTIGAQVMLLVNKIDTNLANGSRGVVVSFSQRNFPIVKFDNGVEIEITPHRWEFCSQDKLICYIDQIPLKLAWAITTHKSQGMSIDVVEIDMTRAFVAGQVYVALSRVRSLDGLYITKIDYRKIKCHPRVIQFYQSINGKCEIKCENKI